jgi:hypothetical protein
MGIWIREKTAAKRAGVPIWMIRDECRSGRLKSQKWGKRGKFLIDPVDFAAWLQQYRQQLQIQAEAAMATAQAPSRRQLSPERAELERQSQRQQQALKRFLDDGDHEGASIVAKALLLTLAELEDER